MNDKLPIEKLRRIAALPLPDMVRALERLERCEEYDIINQLAQGLGIVPGACGGMAHRHWQAAVYRCGVKLYVDNHRIGISCASDPTATVRRGCQDSRVYGDPTPRLSHGSWVDCSRLPTTGQKKVETIVSEILLEVCEWREEEFRLKAKEVAQSIQEAKEEQEQIDAAWS